MAKKNTWTHLSGKTGYITLRKDLLLTYHLNDHEILLFDSGSVKEPALFDLLDQMGVSVYAVLQTHLHGDHTANNTALIERYGCKIYAHRDEIEISKSLDAMQEEWGLVDTEWTREIMAEYASWNMIPFDDSTSHLDMKGAQIGIHHFHGHSKGHVCYATPDNICCAGDTLLSHLLLRFAKVAFLADVTATLESMKAIGETNYDYYLLAHKEVISQAELADVVEANIQKELAMEEEFKKALSEHPELWFQYDDFMSYMHINPGNDLNHDLTVRSLRARMTYFKISIR